MSVELALRLYNSDCAFNAALAKYQAGVGAIAELSLPAVVEAAKPAFALGFSYCVRQDSEEMQVVLRHADGGEEISSASGDTLFSPALLLAGLLGIPVGTSTQSSNPDQHTKGPESVQTEHYAIDALIQSVTEPVAEPAAAEPDLIGPDSPDDLPGDHASLRMLTPDEVELAVGWIKAMPAASRKAFTIGFRTAFEVPDNVVRIAGEIKQLRHFQFVDRFVVEAAGDIAP